MGSVYNQHHFVHSLPSLMCILRKSWFECQPGCQDQGGDHQGAFSRGSIASPAAATYILGQWWSYAACIRNLQQQQDITQLPVLQQTKSWWHVMSNCIGVYTDHAIDFLYSLPQGCSLQSCWKHWTHDAIEAVALVEIPAPYVHSFVSNFFRRLQDGLLIAYKCLLSQNLRTVDG